MIKKVKVYSKSRTMNTGTVDNFGIGITNDNLADTLLFEFDEMIDGQASLLTNIKGDDGIIAPLSLEKTDEGYQLIITKNMLIQKSFNMQLMITNEDFVWHSLTYNVKVKDCLETGTGEMPSGITLWLQEADNKLLIVNEKIEEIDTKESTYQANEETRQSNETTRQTNEANRQAKETERQTNEVSRVEQYNLVETKLENGDFIPNVSVGKTETLEPGSKASVTNSGTAKAPIFDFGIPQGEKGEKGDCNFATFNINLDTGNLEMNKTEDLLLDFAIENGNLEVLI